MSAELVLLIFGLKLKKSCHTCQALRWRHLFSFSFLFFLDFGAWQGLGVGDGALIGNVRKEGKNDQLITFLFVIELRVSQFSAGGLRLDTGFFTVSSHEAPPDDSVCCLQITSPSSVD
eukprot:896394-Pelagomonas_calceolata.AAC.1